MNNNEIKILLTINLEGGVLTRQDKPELIMWSLNERDLNPDKDWKDGEGLKVVKRGSTKHYNFNPKECKQRIKITKDGYDYFISDETAMMQSVPMPKNRKKFFHDYASLTFDVFINKWFADTWNVRINSWLRVTAFKLGVYNKAKRIVKVVLHKK